MAEGLRIRHHTRRNQMVLVPLFHKMFPEAEAGQEYLLPECGKCKTVHLCKTLHLQVDGEGAVLVSKEIWADMQRTPRNGGFILESAVAKPPPQTLQPETKIIKIDGISMDGMIKQPKRKMHSSAGARKQEDELVAEHTWTYDQFIDICNSMGIPTDRARNLLLWSMLRPTTKTNGQEVSGGRDTRAAPSES